MKVNLSCYLCLFLHLYNLLPPTAPGNVTSSSDCPLVNQVPCGTGPDCVPRHAVCDGLPSCLDGSDEAADFCTAWECHAAYSKCRDGVQCRPREAFCALANWRPGASAVRVRPTEVCEDRSQNTVWACDRLGVNCSSSPSLFTCGSGQTDNCISNEYVCDGVPDCDAGLDDVEESHDEGTELCKTWSCSSGWTKCGLRCVRDQSICDGNKDCQNGEDETSLTSSDGELLDCASDESPCRVYSGPYPGATYGRGVRCRSGVRRAGGWYRTENQTCLLRAEWCDGKCHCVQCEDERTDFCDAWTCPDDWFHCRISRKCVPRSSVCDGALDCGAGDRSDEADCPCDRATPRSVGGILRRAVEEQCVQDAACLDGGILQQIHHRRREVRVIIPPECNVTRECELRFSPMAHNLQSDNRTHCDTIRYCYYTNLLLPLVDSEYVYKVISGDSEYVYKVTGGEMKKSGKIDSSGKDRVSNESMTGPVTRMGSTSRAALQMAAHLSNWTKEDLEQQRIYGFLHLNDWEDLVIPDEKYKNARRNYVKNKLKDFLGQHEIIAMIRKDPKQPVEEQPEDDLNTVNLTLNHFFPTITYRPNRQQLQNKNIPFFVHFYLPRRPCSSASQDSLSLLMAAKLASAGILLEKGDSTPWISLSKENFLYLEETVCKKDTVVHEYKVQGGLVYLVLARATRSRHETATNSLRFQFANQRQNLYKTHGLASLNNTVKVTVIQKSYSDPAQMKNRALMAFIYLRQNSYRPSRPGTDITNNATTTLLPDDVRKVVIPHQDLVYHQTGGNTSLWTVLQSINISTVNNCSSKTGPRVCGVCEAIECSTPPVSSAKEIEIALTSRWNNLCINIQVGDNHYVVHPTRKDEYFVLKEKTRLEDFFRSDLNVSQNLLKMGPLQLLGLANFINNSLGIATGLKSHFEQNTYLASISYWDLGLSNMDDITLYPEFYLPTLLSALLRKEDDTPSKCVERLVQGDLRYYHKNHFTFLGPLSNIWESDCVHDLPLQIVEQLISSRGESSRGVSSLNKFWISEGYNFLIFSRRTDSVNESSFLSQSCLAVEFLLFLVIGFILMVILLGNSLTIIIILCDSDSKMTLYQWLQVSLCLADLLLGACGPGHILIFGLLLLSGRLPTSQFFPLGDMFATFRNPRAAAAVGLDNYIMVDKAAMVAAGAGVTLSTTVSILNIALMAATRWAVASGQNFISNISAKAKLCAVLAPWILGIIITTLYLVSTPGYTSLGSASFQAYFDPIAKLSILLPNGGAYMFHIQVAITGVFVVTAVAFTFAAWFIIRKYTVALRKKDMIKQRDQMMKRLNEERRWFYQSCAILGAFFISILPIFIFYISSNIFGRKFPIIIQLLVWWLFISGGFFNFFIYNFINPSFRRKFLARLGKIFCFNIPRRMARGETTTTRITFLSRSKSRESQKSGKSEKRKSGIEERGVELVPLN